VIVPARSAISKREIACFREAKGKRHSTALHGQGTPVVVLIEAQARGSPSKQLAAYLDSLLGRRTNTSAAGERALTGEREAAPGQPTFGNFLKGSLSSASTNAHGYPRSSMSRAQPRVLAATTIAGFATSAVLVGWD